MGEVSDDDINVELLHDIRTVFDDISAMFIGSTELVGKLADLDSRPWGDWKKGKAITTRAVADRLKVFGIVPNPPARYARRKSSAKLLASAGVSWISSSVFSAIVFLSLDLEATSTKLVSLNETRLVVAPRFLPSCI